MPCCKHHICQSELKGVGVCIVDPKKKQVLLGLERFGKYRGKYNLCAGSLEPEDEGCALNAAKRELREEFKLYFHEVDFERHFCFRRQETLRFVMIGPTPVFIGYFDTNNLTPRNLTLRMQVAIQDDTLPGTQKEMEEARWFPWEEQNSMQWSRFARVALKKVMNRQSKSNVIQKTNTQS